MFREERTYNASERIYYASATNFCGKKVFSFTVPFTFEGLGVAGNVGCLPFVRRGFSAHVGNIKCLS